MTDNFPKHKDDYCYLPVLPNGQVDLSSVEIVTTPLGCIARIKCNKHIYLNHYIELTQKQGLMDDREQWRNVPKAVIALWVKRYSDVMKSPPDWAYFEKRWNLNTLKTQIMPDSHANYPRWSKILDEIFEIDKSNLHQ